MSQDPNQPQQPPKRPQWQVQPGVVDDQFDPLTGEQPPAQSSEAPPSSDPLGEPWSDPQGAGQHYGQPHNESWNQSEVEHTRIGARRRMADPSDQSPLDQSAPGQPSSDQPPSDQPPSSGAMPPPKEGDTVIPDAPSHQSTPQQFAPPMQPGSHLPPEAYHQPGYQAHPQPGYAQSSYAQPDFDSQGPGNYGPNGYQQEGYNQAGYDPASYQQQPSPQALPGNQFEHSAPHEQHQNQIPLAQQYAPMQPAERAPSAQDFLSNRHRAADVGPATWGWRGFIRRITFGLIKPRMGPAERTWRDQRAQVQKSFSGPRTVVFANPKGGAAKTTSVLAAGYTFGTIRGGGVVAWDNNETRGTLGIRGEGANHQNTTRELLDDLERFSDVYESRIGDLGAFVRSQGDAHFDVLASDERADVTGQIKASDFGAVHRLLERFYHLILVDTGNNLRAENWLAAAQTADLIVVTCTVREDTGYSGLWMLDALEDAGHHDLRRKTITVLADPSPNVDSQLAKDLTAVYEQRTRAVYRVPYDSALVAGSVIDYARLSDSTRTAWLAACAGMAEAL